MTPTKHEIDVMGKDEPMNIPENLKFDIHVEDNRIRVHQGISDMSVSSGLWVWAVRQDLGAVDMFRVIRNGSGDRYVADLSTTYTYVGWRTLWTPVAIVFRPTPVMEERPI